LKQQQLEAEMKDTVGDGTARTGSPSRKNPKNPRERDPRQKGQGFMSIHGEPYTRPDV